MRALLASLVVACALTVVDASPTRAAAAASWQVTPSPFQIAFTNADGAPLTSEVPGDAGPGARLSYELTGGARHTVTNLISTETTAEATTYRVATDETGRTATVTLSHVADGVRVAWRLQPSTGVARVYETLAADTTDHFLGSGIRARYVDLARQVVPLKVHFTPAFFLGQCNQTSTPAPFFASDAGWGVHLRHADIGRLAFPGAIEVPDPPQCFNTSTACPVRSAVFDRVQTCINASRLDYDLLVGTPLQIASAYTRAAGTPDVPPLASYGLTKWRESVTGPAEVLDDIDQLQSRGIPVTSVLLDNPWETDGAANSFTGSACVGSLQFDRDQFPNPAATIAEVHRRGVRFVLWVAPFFLGGDCPDPGYPAGSVVEGESQADAVPPPFGTFLGAPPRDLDLTNPATRAAYVARLANVFALGVDGVKGDRGDETDFESSTFAGGPGTALHNQVPVLYQQAVRDALRAARVRRGEPAEDSTMLFRAGGPGSTRATTGMWGGDQEMTIAGLRLAVRMGQTAGASGFAVWGSDIGGYSGPVTDIALGQTPLPAGEDALPTESVLLRWAQFSAFTPVMELGGRGRQQQLWANYSPTAIDVFRDFTRLHYALVPHFDDLVRAAHATGAPVLRPLALQFPDDPASWAADQQFMLGDNLLVAPVTLPTIDATDPADATVAPVVIPPGLWVDLFSGLPEVGPRPVSRLTPRHEVPAYLRLGSAVAFNGQQPDVWAAPWPVAALDMPGRAGWLWAPGPGPTSTTTVATSATAGTMRASVDRARWTIELTSDRPELQVIAVAVAPPETITVNGVELQRFANAGALRGAASGWAPSDGPIGNVVVKFTAKAKSAAVGATGELPRTGDAPKPLLPLLALMLVVLSRARRRRG